MSGEERPLFVQSDPDSLSTRSSQTTMLALPIVVTIRLAALQVCPVTPIVLTICDNSNVRIGHT